MQKDKKEKIIYRSLEPGMTGALVKCIRSVYADTYPLPEFYKPHEIERLLSQKLLYSEVAINEDGDIVANLSTQLERTGDYTADTSAGMVFALFRGYGVIGRLGQRMAHVYGKLGLCGVQLYAITLHTITQKQILEGGGVVTGILPAHFSKGTSADGFKEARWRVGAVLFYLPLKKLPSRSVYIPEGYRDQICSIYKQIKCDRETLAPGKDKLPDNSIYKTSLNIKTGVISICFERVGADIVEVLSLLDTAASENACEVQYLDLPLDNPGCGLAVDIAGDKGFLYGGLIMERCGSDRLRLQKLDHSTFLSEDIKITSEEAISFLNLCLKEMGTGQ